MEGLGQGINQSLRSKLKDGILTHYQSNRNREASVAISPDWNMLEEIEFHRLAKLRLEVDDPEDL